jgi:hypothetical protein
MQFINAFNAPLSWLRVIKYLEALSPTTRQVIHVAWLVISDEKRGNASNLDISIGPRNT